MQRRSRTTGDWRCAPSVIPAPNRHPCAPHPPPLRPQPSFLRRQEPTSPQHFFPPPFPNSSLPPSRGEVRWGVERRAQLRRCSAFRFLFLRLFRGDPGGLPIWSERLAAFRFVQVCSDLFRVVQGVIGVDGRAGGAEPVGARGGGHCSHFRSSRLW